MPLYLREFEKIIKNQISLMYRQLEDTVKIADICNTSYSEIAVATYNNACDFFDIKQ